MALNHEQRKIASLIVQIGRHSGRSRKEIVSALETGLVESGLRNLRGGTGSSVGWRQETASSYPGVNRRNVRQSIKRYYNETKAAGGGRGKTAGQLAAAVQRPDPRYVGRYGQQRGTALSIYRHLAKGVPLGSGGTPGTPGSVVSNRTVSVTTPQADLSSGVDLTALLTQQQPRPVYASAPAPPAFSASNSLALPKGYATPEASPVQPQQDTLQQQLQAIASTAGPSVTHPQVNVSGSSIGIPGTPGTKGSRGGRVPGGHGVVRVAGGADRAGAHTRPVVKRYLSHVAALAHQPITVTTGTNHNRLTVDGNVSDHWSGHAADIAVPVDSHRGDVIATSALIEAGVPRARARAMARRGGLYTITHNGLRIQVIWKTTQGGNHHNHVHVGVRPA